MPVVSDSALHAIQHALAGRYEIEARIGRGGMGTVYLARDVRLDRPVALKVLPPELAAERGRRERFLWEARTAAALTHPNIVSIHAVHEAPDWVAFAMGYVAGETLSQRVARSGPLPPDGGARLLREIAEALAYAHACGVVHRDVKPDNILLDTVTGRAHLTDFGIAHVSPDGGRAPAGSIVGTPAFMSPEQARGEPVDGRSDLYSLGCTGFYALSGRLPFAAASDAALLEAHSAEPPAALATVVPAIPAGLAQVVDRCLAKDPRARFADARALIRAVDDAAEPLPAPAVRAFLVRGAYLAGPARLHALLTGLVLVPAVAKTWLTGGDPVWRVAAASALGIALLLPVIIAVTRARWLLNAGHQRQELVAALHAAHARRRDELANAYGAAPSAFERGLQWTARAAVVTAAAVVGLWSTESLPQTIAGTLPPVAAALALLALLAGVAARARTEQRTEPRGLRRVRFWRGALGRAVFRIAALGVARGRAARAVERIAG